MPLRALFRIGNETRLAEIKQISGWCLEQRRGQLHIKQEVVASDAGLTSRWVREIEAGNPKAKLDDHFKCAAALDLSAGYMMIPMLFMERNAEFPRELLLPRLAALEERCVGAISDEIVGGLRQRLSPGRLETGY